MVSWWGILEQGRQTLGVRMTGGWVRPLYGGGQRWEHQESFVQPRTELLFHRTFVLGKDRNKLVRKGAQKEDSSGCEEKSRWLWQRTLRWVCPRGDPWKSAQRQWLLIGEARLFEWQERAFTGQFFSLFCLTVPDMTCEKEEIIAEIEYCQSWCYKEL